ncbi:MAG: adenylate/guanylate cyclase domain-containing protein [Acidimicrobiales bacterium]
MEERKLATVLFADVVGFTSLAERTDPELLARMVDASFSELARVVVEHGGTVDKYMGDSLMAVFGVPVAHDDDAERALAAALAMRELGGDLVFSIGVNSGEVMASAVGGGSFTVMGDTVNVAARLEKAAGPGEVLCGPLTAQLAGQRIEFTERQPVVLKGKSQPLPVWEARRLRRGQATSAHDTPMLVGRKDECNFLEAQWRRVRDDGQARLLVLCGEAGSGKTRLLDELASEAEGTATVVRAGYPAYGLLGGVQVAADLIEQLGPSIDPEVESRVRSVAGDMTGPLRDMDATAVRREQLWALGRLLREKAAEQPLLITIDDLQWGDEPTLSLLSEVAVRMRDVPVLTVVAGRTEPGAWLSRFAGVATLRLSPLSRSDATELAQRLVGGCALDDDARRFLADMAGGNPLYLRELVSMARERGLLEQHGDRLRLSAHAGIPATLQALLAARLDALDRTHKTLLQHIAVLGEASVAELTAFGIEAAEDLVESLLAGGLLRTTSDGRYVTADPLLGEVAYDMLPHHQRGELHRRASALVWAPEERVRHLERAADFLVDDKDLGRHAALALAEEGEELASAGRPIDALRVLEKAVALGIDRTSTLLEMARLQALGGKEREARETLERVPDDPDDPSVAAERDHQKAATQMFTDPAFAAPALVAAAQRWAAIGNVDKEAWAYANAGVAYFSISQMETAGEMLERAWSQFENLGDRFGAVASSSFLCLARPMDPRVSGWLAEALELADTTGDRWRQVTTLIALSWKHFFRAVGGGVDEVTEFEEFATRLALVSEEVEAWDMAVHGWALLALSARLTGRFDVAVERVAELQRVERLAAPANPWLAWAASFAVALATGEPGAAAPFPPADSVDPVVLVASLIVVMALLLAGRAEEALPRVVHVPSPSAAGPLAEMIEALALVLVGRAPEALDWVSKVREVAELLQCPPAILAASSLEAEITGDKAALPAVPASVTGVAGVLALRAHAQAGDDTARRRLADACAALATPGLDLTP